MKHLINLGTQFIGFRDEADDLRGKTCLIFGNLISLPSTCFYFVIICLCSLTIFPEALRRAEKRADDLAAKLELSEKAREKAEKDAATVGDLRQRLQNAEHALSDKITQQIERESAIADRFDTQNRSFVSKFFPSTISVFILTYFLRY
jgi:hypothetical protein